MKDHLPETAGADATGEVHSLDTDRTILDREELSSSTSATILIIWTLDIFIKQFNKMRL